MDHLSSLNEGIIIEYIAKLRRERSLSGRLGKREMPLADK